MSSMTISLPDEMQAWVETQAQNGGFSSAGDYVSVVLAEMKARKEAELRALLLEGVNSESRPVTTELWAQSCEELETGLAQAGDGK